MLSEKMKEEFPELPEKREKTMNNHLPLLGAGPAFVGVITPATIAALTLNHRNIIKYGDLPAFRPMFHLAGIVLILLGVLLWGLANYQCRIRENILRGNLVTTGIYGHVRNPILSGHLLANAGLLLLACNLMLAALPLGYWIYMTILLRATEEKWLKALHGQKYTEYCRRVNRCIPWF